MSKGVTFYFVRHGETWFNRYGRLQGWANVDLTPEGVEGVQKTGEGLKDIKFDAVYTSDLQRTIDTAMILLDENNFADEITLEALFELREVSFGYYEGLQADELWPMVGDEVELKYNLPRGSNETITHVLDTIKELDPYKRAENYAEFWQRVEKGLLYMLDKHAYTDEKVLVVSHGMTIRNLLHGLVADYDEVESLKNASVSVVSYRGGQFELLAYNQTENLDQLPQGK